MEPDLRVLLIKDDPAVAEMYSYRLEIDGYQVTVAPDGEIGLALAIDTRPDLIYLDLRLPGPDGFAGP
jgi:DNA-binding response OmpR family regulator